MKKVLIVVAAFLLTLVVGTGVVFAQAIDSQKVVEVKKDEVVSHDYFASGDEVKISGKVDGDAFVFAQKIIIDGEVNGDLIAAGGEILIPGKVDHDARLAASKISLSGTVDGNVTAGTGEFTFDRNGRIGNNLILGTKDVSLQGYIGKDLSAWANKITVNNNVGGTIKVAATDLTLDPGARVAGDVIYWASNNLTVNLGSDIKGQIVKHEIKNTDKVNKNLEKTLAGTVFALKVFGFVFYLLLGLLVIKLLPVFSYQVSDFINKKAVKSFLIGILMLFVVPLLFVILLLTIVGIPFAFIFLLFSILIFCTSKIFIALAIGNFLEGKFKLNNSNYLKFAGGLIIITLISAIPIIGGVFSLITFFVGIGAYVSTLFALHKSLLAKKLI